MSSYQRRARANGNGGLSGRTLLAVAALALTLPAVAISAGSASGGGAKAGRLRADLAQMTELTNQHLRPPAKRLAGGLPGERDRLDRLREPASTAQAQAKTTLDELRQMSALTRGPHYLAALIAAGRAYTAISGLDPLTATAVNPEYPGLVHELEVGVEQLDRLGGEAGELPGGIKRLKDLLVRSKRHVRLLERRLRRVERRARATRPRQR